MLNRGQLNVPAHIFQMPCGCKKKPRDLWLFRLFYENGEWVHHCPHNARGIGTPIIPREKEKRSIDYRYILTNFGIENVEDYDERIRRFPNNGKRAQ